MANLALLSIRVYGPGLVSNHTVYDYVSHCQYFTLLTLCTFTQYHGLFIQDFIALLIEIDPRRGTTTVAP